MPWTSNSIFEARRNFVMLALSPNSNIRALCRRFNISPNTGYQTLERYRAAGEKGLQDRSTVQTAPLPARAQFLNVIESIFSGMSRAIIQNSDYQSVDDAKAAVDRYFNERNAHFRDHPRRAGAKVWGKEPGPPTFLEFNNCKDPRFR